MPNGRKNQPEVDTHTTHASSCDPFRTWVFAAGQRLYLAQIAGKTVPLLFPVHGSESRFVASQWQYSMGSTSVEMVVMRLMLCGSGSRYAVASVSVQMVAAACFAMKLTRTEERRREAV